MTIINITSNREANVKKAMEKFEAHVTSLSHCDLLAQQLVTIGAIHAL